MAVQLNKRLVSVDDYHLMHKAGILSVTDKLELIRGEILFKSPIGSRHSLLVNRLTTLLFPKIPSSHFISVQNPVQLSEYSEPEPNLAIVQGPMDRFADQHPKANDISLLIEVADSSLSTDQEIKLPLYAESKIKEFWIINIEKEEVEQHSNPDKSTYMERKIYRKGSEIHLKALDIRVSIDQIFP